MKTIKIILVIIMSILLEVIISPLRLLGIEYSTVFGFFIYFFYVLLIYRYLKTNYGLGTIAILVALGIILIQLPIRIFSFSSSLYTLPDMFFHIFGVFSAFFFLKSSRIRRFVVLSTSILVVLWMVIFGYPIWQSGIDYDSFNGRLLKTGKIQIRAYKSDGKILTNSDLKSEYILLDFWFMGCKPCFDEFPRLQRAYDNPKYKGKVTIYAMNLAMNTDTANQAFQVLKSKGYSFANLVQKKVDSPNSLGIKICPTTVILDKNRNLIFKGELKKAEEYLAEVLK